MKKIVPIVGIFLVLLGVGGALLFKKATTKPTASPAPTKKPKLTIPANTIPVSERPYVMLEPTAAREVVMTLYNLPKKADSVDFELQYSAGEKEEAAIGSIDLNKSFPYAKTILLGSKSGGGKITYHENVTGGSLVLSFYDENYKLSNEWSYIENKNAKKPVEIIGSRDGKFSLNIGKLLKANPYIIVYQNPGLPKEVEGDILAGPYSVSVTGNLPVGKVDLEMRLSEDVTKAKLMTWDGKAWTVTPVTAKDKMVSVKADLVQTYVVVKE